MDIHTMTRFEIITELARHAHPSWYHSLTDWHTAQLAALLTYYRAGGEGEFPTDMVGKIYRTKGLGDPHKDERIVIGIDLGNGDSKTVAFVVGREIIKQLKIKNED